MSPLRGFQKLTSVEEALQKFLALLKINGPGVETILLNLALNRVLAELIAAEEDLPRFDRSAVDGYAVKAEDTVEASQYKPRIMTIIDGKEIGGKQAKQVWTGNSIPKGADAVAMLENTKRIDDRIEVWTPLTPGENVSRRGEDIQKGETALEAGTRLKPHHLGLIAALGISTIKVFEKPRIAILATGDELVDLGSKRQGDQVFDVNRQVVSALCQELGAEPVDLGIAKDNAEEIMKKLRAGLRTGAIITTGGTSVGGSDFVPEAVNNIGKPGVVVHGIAMRPAMPTTLAVINGKPIVILSGNPVASMIGFEVFARPLICRMTGLKEEEPRPVVIAKMARKATASLGRKTYVRVRVFEAEGKLLAEPISTRGSGVISTMTRSNGYVVVPENREGIGKGETVSVHLFDNMKVAHHHV